MQRINFSSWSVLSERRARRNALKLRVVRIFGLVTLVSLLVALGTAAMGEEPSLLDLAATVGELIKPGEFQDDILEWDRKHIAVYWKGDHYRKTAPCFWERLARSLIAGGRLGLTFCILAKSER